MSIRNILILLFPLCTYSKHSHHANHLHPREVVIPVVAAGSTVASTTASTSDLPGDAAIQDIQDIQQGLEDLPKDLLSFVQGVEARLQTIEELLEAMISGSPSTPPPTTVPPVPLPSPYPEEESTGTSTLSTTTFISTSNINPTTTTRTRTSRITQTNTHTVTPVPITSTVKPYNGTTNGTSPASSGTAAITYTVSLALTGPYETTLQTRTRAVRTPISPKGRGL